MKCINNFIINKILILILKHFNLFSHLFVFNNGFLLYQIYNFNFIINIISILILKHYKRLTHLFNFNNDFLLYEI